MKTIYKYDIYPYMTSILLPIGAEILCVKMQSGEPKLWAVVDRSEVQELRYIEIIPTGYDFMDEGLKYIDTFMPEDGLVFHLFERIN